MNTLDQLQSRVIETANAYGFTARVVRSNISESRYIFISNGLGFDAPKSVRRAYCAAVGPFPRGSALCVRVSDHHGYGDGSTVHVSVRADLGPDAGIEKLSRALGILATHNAARAA